MCLLLQYETNNETLSIMRKTLVLFFAAVSLLACKSPKSSADEPKIKFPQERRDAIATQCDSVMEMLADSSMSAEELCAPLKRLGDTLRYVISNDLLFETNHEMRAFVRHLAYELICDKRGIDPDCFVWSLYEVPYLWLVSHGDSNDCMYTSFFRSSGEAWARFSTLALAGDVDGRLPAAVLTVTNYIDTVIDNLEIEFQYDVNHNETIGAEDVIMDTSDAASGIVRVILDSDDIVARLKKCGVVCVRYNAKTEEVDMRYINYKFEDQLACCPFIAKRQVPVSNN